MSIKPIQHSAHTSSPASTNVVWHHATVTRARRESQNGRRSSLVYGTVQVRQIDARPRGRRALAPARLPVVRPGWRECASWTLRRLGVFGFGSSESIRRIGEVGKLFMEAGVIVLAAFISPYRADRERVRGMVVRGDFIEIYCDAPIEVCEARDVKGMYKKVRAGQIAEFTGISSPYEVPDQPDLTVEAGRLELDVCVSQVMGELERPGVIEKHA